MVTAEKNDNPEIPESELLKDPCNDRVVKEVRPPPHAPLTIDKVFPLRENGERFQTPNYQLIKQYIKENGVLSKDLMMRLIDLAMVVLDSEPNLMRLDGQTHIFGDIHGQVYDLIGILEGNHIEALDAKVESPEKANYLFLGDYVDRGPFGPEVIALLLALKLNYPKSVVLLRGNHETREITQEYNYRDQCLKVFGDEEMYDRCMELFDLLPLACCVNGEYLCVHGGVSVELTSLATINRIDRKREPIGENMLTDLLWADPQEDRLARGSYFSLNDARNCSVYFGEKPVNNLMKRDKLQGIVRAHECVIEGYERHYFSGKNQPSRVTTIFSAPNYCGRGNFGAYITTNKGNEDLFFTQYRQTAAVPFYLPKRKNAFVYYMTDIGISIEDFICRLLTRLLKSESEEELKLTQQSSAEEPASKREEMIQEKNPNLVQMIKDLKETLNQKQKEKDARTLAMQMQVEQVDEYIDQAAAKEVLTLRRQRSHNITTAFDPQALVMPLQPARPSEPIRLIKRKVMSLYGLPSLELDRQKKQYNTVSPEVFLRDNNVLLDIIEEPRNALVQSEKSSSLNLSDYEEEPLHLPLPQKSSLEEKDQFDAMMKLDAKNEVRKACSEPWKLVLAAMQKKKVER